MAIAQFAWFKPVYGHEAEVNTVEFWFMMQLAMVAGFATAYPVNWLLIKTGVKEKMWLLDKTHPSSKNTA